VQLSVVIVTLPLGDATVAVELPDNAGAAAAINRRPILTPRWTCLEVRRGQRSRRREGLSSGHLVVFVIRTQDSWSA